MKKINNGYLAMIFTFFLTTGILAFGWNSKEAFCGGIESLHTDRSTPSQGLMRIINSHTSKMLDAIMIGDFKEVIKESKEIINASEVVMRMFFPEEGKAGEWFQKAGNDPDDPKAVQAMKDDFEKYLNLVTDAAKKVAETSRRKNIVETYNSFDSMLRKACFKCHQTSRLEWPGWMKKDDAK
ncbi:hypothetical protein SCALIN_C05_0056 [Candidatus Scalindua japonica]|uniref:Cytochrome c n=1 Tax=Candidatus Scalindua japonica TaxID=1284222 RepID=A0A286TVW9_9BACT|nr:cytochrome c [Candidatus Scalindua japonica]GAX59971.1 hypothetical protein SCALIN_C05_0056 [Candidatus Scalindua japonica]